MQSLILQEPGKLEFVDVPKPTPAAGEALVRVLSCGVCGTDIHAYSGKQPFFSYPRRLGHELCVEVLEAPEGSALVPGDRCAVEPYYFCGECPACKSGKTNCCHSLQVLGVHIDGGHQPEITIPAQYLHKSDQLSPDQLALVEPLAIGAHAIERANPAKGEPLVVLGMGPIGLTVAIFAKAAGADVVLVDIDEGRLNFAAETMQLGTPMLAGEDLGDRLQAKFGQLPSCIIDATGSPRSMNNCFNFAEHGGRVVFVGLFIGDLQFDDPNFHRRELTLYASRAALSSTFGKVIEMIETGVIDPLPLITHRLQFETLDQQLPTIHEQVGLVKAMIDF
ncbi:zinc-binding alcohol dehydrogenase family protein [Coraliomargarita akajimensis]|uniref:Alcohol dehydrogenase GroES domain protein n=1 Tax=Coraliomargarita akajimensis (strain DSM 45221 / IAM 15411 / JCM 23193 / KCTC 12865 / 04OKA010-24) TaxID=583355 RepID=D5EQU7_CORAD|nr:zinc-binding alcohol dehydrogenase family protein [Coraliomargarita akajimensis]ADE53940.1 Alcohol dehydrogenase GroES domain protein [Coraliomargarita akajimensis DSM 45221]